MEEIKVGEYVRTKYGIIDKVINPDFYINIYIECEKDLITKSKIKKHSPNIIDLIEVGDYVNGREVVEFDCEDETILAFPIYTSDGLFNTIEGYVPLEEFEIKSIVTKENFKSVSYEV